MFGGPLTNGLVNNNGAIVQGGPPGIPDCVASLRPGMVNLMGARGLPGFAGGGKKRKQHGGRYGFVSAGAAPTAAPWAGGLAPMSAIAPERAVVSTPQLGAQLGAQLGGGQFMTPAPVGGDNQAIFNPTSGYSMQVGQGVSSTGTPFLNAVGYAGVAPNAACVKTGGARSTRARLTKRSKHSRLTKRSKHSRRTKHATRQ